MTETPKEQVLFMPKQLLAEEKALKLEQLFKGLDNAYRDVEGYLVAISEVVSPEQGAFFQRMADFEEQNRLQATAQKAEVLR